MFSCHGSEAGDERSSVSTLGKSLHIAARSGESTIRYHPKQQQIAHPSEITCQIAINEFNYSPVFAIDQTHVSTLLSWRRLCRSHTIEITQSKTCIAVTGHPLFEQMDFATRPPKLRPKQQAEHPPHLVPRTNYLSVLLPRRFEDTKSAILQDVTHTQIIGMSKFDSALRNFSSNVNRIFFSETIHPCCRPGQEHREPNSGAMSRPANGSCTWSRGGCVD